MIPDATTRHTAEVVYADFGFGGNDIPLGFRKALEAVKEGVPIGEYAGTLTRLRANGSGQVGRCPIPDHDDGTPSFHVYPDGHAHCYGCGFHGDVIDLCAAVEGGETWECMLILSSRYGVDLPERPQSWYRRQERQRPIRDGLERVKLRSLRRRLFRMFEPMIAAIPDPEERAIEAGYVWDELTPLAVRMVEERRGVKHDA